MEGQSKYFEEQPGDTVVRMEGLSTKMPIEELLKVFDLIGKGKVSQILPSRKGSEGSLDIIYTDVVFEISKSLYGNPDNSRVAIRLWGGRVGNESTIVRWEPVLIIGEEIVVFLFIPPNNVQPIPEGFTSENYYKVAGSSQGKWVVEGTKIINDKSENNEYTMESIEQKIFEIKHPTTLRSGEIYN